LLYQEGALDSMLPVAELIQRGFGGAGLPDSCAMFGGTFAAKGWHPPAAVSDTSSRTPFSNAASRHAYDVIELPVLG
jgi:hypothetical protein